MPVDGHHLKPRLGLVEDGEALGIGVRADAETQPIRPNVGLRRWVVQQPQIRGGLREHRRERILRQAEGEGEGGEQPAPEGHDRLVVAADGLAKAGQIGPHVGAEEAIARGEVGIVGRQVGGEVERLLAADAGLVAVVFLPRRHVAPVVARLRNVIAALLVVRQGVKAGGLFVGGRDQRLGHTMAGDVEEPCCLARLADGVAERAAGGVLSSVEGARVDNRDHAPARRKTSAYVGWMPAAPNASRSLEHEFWLSTAVRPLAS